ncbi:MAG: hypothetical protein ACE14M_11510 [Terriglobales bacterium]
MGIVPSSSERQQDSGATRKISIRLVLISGGVLLAIAGWALHRDVIAYAGLVLVLAASLIAGGGT